MKGCICSGVSSGIPTDLKVWLNDSNTPGEELMIVPSRSHRTVVNLSIYAHKPYFL